MIDPANAGLVAYLSEKRALTGGRVAELAAELAERLAEIGPEGAGLADALRDFTLPGKMLRGALVFLGRDLFGAEPSDVVVARVAAAMELFQTGLLVHDDIMDRDELRRGMKTLHRAYADAAERAGSRDPGHEGLSLGICAADTAFFAGFEELASCGAAPDAIRGIVALAGRELAGVAFAQMRDVRWGISPEAPTADDVLRMYRHKTARYTFSLPLAAGALLAGKDPDTVGILAGIGEDAGVAFQIRDDELGLFGSGKKLGKPLGSDIREGKMTMYRVALECAAGPEDRQRLSGIFGYAEAGPSEMDYVRGLLEGLGVRREVGLLAESFASGALGKISSLDAAPGPGALLQALVGYVSTRES
ncbi:MAG: polyprenyl synthetase family protein [Spirochaetes bacterium]|nr:polyprenyl synthetase family protein [Spirochaetota bacterium]